MKMTFRPKFTHQSMSSTMTDSTDEKPTSRQNRLSPQSENFDFELAEIQVIPDNINLAPSPIAHFSDDEVTEHPTISGDKTKKLSAENTIAANGFVANESILQPTQTISDIKTSFYVDGLKKFTILENS